MSLHSSVFYIIANVGAKVKKKIRTVDKRTKDNIIESRTEKGGNKMTEKLYYQDSRLASFDAVVLRCTPAKDGYAVALDRTAFFPEGGGQYADVGTLGNARVTDVQETDGVILHYTDAPLSEGETVRGEIDFALRFARMQNHSGEHIVSGIVHRLFGLDNVGFHLSDDDMTVDYNGVLTREELDRVETLANAAVAQNLRVETSFPDPAALPSMTYRSKLELTENVRLVTIGDVDCCACCAPHVSYTGEIGAIKILDFEHYKGGVRCHMLCGEKAMADYRDKYDNVRRISSLLAVPQTETADAVNRLLDALRQKDYDLAGLRRALCLASLDFAEPSAHCICFFAHALCDMDALRFAVNRGMERATVCAGFLPTESGMRYCIGSSTVDLRAQSRTINAALQGRGGGQTSMIQGTAAADAETITRFFADFAPTSM